MASQGVISILSHPSQPCGCESLKEVKEDVSYLADRLQHLEDDVSDTAAVALQNRYALKGDMDVSFLQKPGAEQSLSHRMVVTETQVGGLSERVASLETVSNTLAAQQEVVNKKLALLQDATQTPACKCPSVEHIRDFVQKQVAKVDEKVIKVDERVTALRKRVAQKFDGLQEFCVQGFATAQRGVSKEEMVRELERRQEGMMEVMRREVEEQRSRTAAEEWQVQAENGRRLEDVEDKVGHVAQEVDTMRRREWEREATRGATAGYGAPSAGYGGQGSGQGYGESWQGAGASQWGNTPGVAQGPTLGVEIGGGEGGRGAQGREGQGASSPPLHTSTSASTGQGLQGLDGGQEKSGGSGGLWGVKVGVGLGVMGLLAIAVSLMVGLEGHSLMVKEGADPSYMTSYSGAKVWGDVMGDFKLNVNLKEKLNSALTTVKGLLPDVRTLKSKVNFNFNINFTKTPGDKTQVDDAKVSGPSVQASGTRPEAAHHDPTPSTDVTTHADTSKAPAPTPAPAPQQSEVELALDGPLAPPNGEAGFVVLAPGEWDDAPMQQGPHDKPDHAHLKGQEDTAPQAPPTTPTDVQAPAMHTEGPDGEAPEGELTFGEAQSREGVQERPDDERDERGGAMEGPRTPRGDGGAQEEQEEEGHGGTHDQPMEEEGEEQGEEHEHWEGQDRGEGDGEAAHSEGEEGGDGGQEEYEDGDDS